MSYGERAALEGVVAQLRPRLALEIGTGQGGSLECLARHSAEVHTIDLVEAPTRVHQIPKVTVHTGDSRELVPALLREFESRGRNVDFVLIDGDHSAEGVRRDLENVLHASAVSQSLILAHDTMNDIVRSGLESVDVEKFDKVVYFDLDFVPGYFVREGPFRHELWGGLGFFVVDAARSWTPDEVGRQTRFFEAYRLVRPIRDAVLEQEAAGEPVSLELASLAQSGASAEDVSRPTLGALEALRRWLRRR